MIGQLLTGRYLILKTLGAGGFSETYLARDKYLPHHPLCVVKCLKVSSNSTISLEAAQQLFEAEARILDQLGQSHAQIPKLFAFCREQDQIYQVQEYIEGDNLGDWVAQDRRLPADAAIDLLSQVLPVLDYVHSRRVIHCDIKPSNLIQQHQDGKIVLIDFGAACLGKESSSVDKQENLLAIGTPGYMPEEQEAGKAQFNSDIYALGVSIIHLLTGIHPQRLQRDPITGELDWQGFLSGSSLEPKLLEILDRMVRTHARDRYQRAVDVLSDLFLLTGVHPPTKNSAIGWRRSIQKIVKPAVAAVLLVGMVGGGYLYQHRYQTSAFLAQFQGSASSRQALTWLRDVPIESTLDRMLITPDSEVLVTAEANHVLHLWSLPDGELLNALHGHTDAVTTLEMSRDGKLLVSGSDDRTVRLWDVETGTLLRTFEGHDQGITAVGISPDGQTIASSSKDSALHLWDLQTGALLQTLTVSTGTVTAITFGAANRLFSASSDYQIQDWDLQTGTLQRTFTGHTAPITGLRMSEDNTLFSFGADRTLVWDIERETLVRVFSEDSANPMTTLLDDQYVVTVHDNGSVRRWTREAGRLVKTVSGGFEQSLDAVLSADHRYLVSWSPTRRLQVWQMSEE
ncbi:protein kinase domain-containing protein [Egbenema bharatensis]|uniref:protein kinase domain-containing protein n=1 Tax=Egbenema bharatensis TaxID=3463334 RepID=UPI003A83FD17